MSLRLFKLAWNIFHCTHVLGQIREGLRIVKNIALYQGEKLSKTNLKILGPYRSENYFDKLKAKLSLTFNRDGLFLQLKYTSTNRSKRDKTRILMTFDATFPASTSSLFWLIIGRQIRSCYSVLSPACTFGWFLFPPRKLKFNLRMEKRRFRRMQMKPVRWKTALELLWTTLLKVSKIMDFVHSINF